MDFLDPTTESSWVNRPAPIIDPSVVEAVESMMGRNVFGQPNLRFAWGQTELKFQRGKMRLKYVDKRIPPIEHTRNVLKRPLLVDESGKTLTWETQVVAQFPSVIPEGWLAEVELVELEFIGDQLFYLEQYIPADRLGDTPETWEEKRYEDWEDPEIGFVAHCDVLGPFPSEGQYRDVFAIGEPYVYPAFTDDGEPYEGEYLRFRMPGMDTVEALQEKLFQRENTRLPSAKERGKQRFADYNQARERQFNRNAEERKAWFRDALNTTGKREALARRIGRNPSPPLSMNIPLGIPREQLTRELTALNRHQRRAAAKLERAA
jgi:hypothetical protein